MHRFLKRGLIACLAAQICLTGVTAFAAEKAAAPADPTQKEAAPAAQPAAPAQPAAQPAPAPAPKPAAGVWKLTQMTLGESTITTESLKESEALGEVCYMELREDGTATFYNLPDDEDGAGTWDAASIVLDSGAAAYTLAVQFGRVRGHIDEAEYHRLIEELLTIPEKIERVLEDKERLQWFAAKFANAHDIFFIGRGIDYAISLEGSLKMKEISYIHSEAYAAGELKHGTIALIEEDRPVIALACYEVLFDKMMSNIKEVKARGAQVLAVVLEGNRQIFAEADDVIFIPKTEPMFNSLPEIIPLQLFAYYVARENGCDIDKPKNLAKSVTVE